MRKLLIIIFLLASLSGLAQSADGLFQTVTASGTNSYTIAAALPNASAYDAKEKFIVVFTNASTGSVTLSRNGLTAKPVRDSEGTQLGSGDILAGQRLLLSYNGTYYQVIGGTGSGSVSQTITNGVTDSSPSEDAIFDRFGNVDNTPDASKPVSTATQTALDAKQATLVSGTNIKTVGGNSLLGSGNVTEVSQTITNGVTTTSPSEDAVFDANAAQIAQTITDGVTTSATSEDKLFDRFAEESTITSNTQTDNYTLVLSDGYPKSKIIEVSKATAVTLTVPTNTSVAFPVGTIIWVRRTGAGTLTLAGVDGTVTITGSAGVLTDPGLNVTMILRKTGTNTWDLQNGTPGTYSTWVPTYTGFSSAPTGVTARYFLIGKMCHVYVSSTGVGTSNSTSKTITLPFAAANTLAQQFYFVGFDNGATSFASRVVTTVGSNILTCYGPTFTSSTSWTASNGANIVLNFVYEIQ